MNRDFSGWRRGEFPGGITSETFSEYRDEKVETDKEMPDTKETTEKSAKETREVLKESLDK
jgi:hypothetical protein